MRDTLRKTSEKFLDGDIVTPMMIICSDPPQEDLDKDMITYQHNKYQNDLNSVPIKKMKTMFKVIKSICF